MMQAAPHGQPLLVLVPLVWCSLYHLQADRVHIVLGQDRINRGHFKVDLAHAILVKLRYPRLSNVPHQVDSFIIGMERGCRFCISVPVSSPEDDKRLLWDVGNVGATGHFDASSPAAAFNSSGHGVDRHRRKRIVSITLRR